MRCMGTLCFVCSSLCAGYASPHHLPAAFTISLKLFQPAVHLIFSSYTSPLYGFNCVSRKTIFGLFDSQGLDLGFYTGDTQTFLRGYLDSVLEQTVEIETVMSFCLFHLRSTVKLGGFSFYGFK